MQKTRSKRKLSIMFIFLTVFLLVSSAMAQETDDLFIYLPAIITRSTPTPEPTQVPTPLPPSSNIYIDHHAIDIFDNIQD